MALLTLLPIILPLGAAAQTADEIVNKALAARGGVEKIKAVQAQRITGTISFGVGAEGPFMVELKRPGKMHMEMTIGDQLLVRSYDGKSAGWTINPFAESKDVQPMAGDDLKNISDESDFDGPLVDYKAKGNQIEFAGKEDVEGKPSYRIKLTNKNSDVRYYIFDASSYQLLKWEGTRKADDKEYPVESFFRDYRDVKGIKFAFEIDSDSPGTEQNQKIVVEKLEVDPQIDESHFGKPSAPPAPEPGAAPETPAPPADPALLAAAMAASATAPASAANPAPSTHATAKLQTSVGQAFLSVVLAPQASTQLMLSCSMGRV